ncbi:MAG: HAMP domain-containing protein [Deltaproteobacteria bacterium]|nr:HAMP domain-containing protein [Deltaproteobacteria bacterium]
MKLKTRLAIWFLLVALVPLGVVTAMLAMRTEDSFEESFKERFEGIESGVQQRLRAIASELDRALRKIAADPIITRELLEPLGRGRFYDNPELDYERAIVRDARRLMTSAVLDTLRLVDVTKGGHVIAMGHRTGVEPPDQDLLQLISAHSDSAFFRYERVENYETGKADEIWTLQVTLVATDGRAKVALVGGKIVDRQLVDQLRLVAGAGTEIALDDREGRRVAATFDGAEPPPVVGGYASTVRELRNPASPDTVARLRVFVPRTELVQRTESLVQTSVILASAFGAAALLIGLFLARRLTRPLEALAAAATDVAGGARDKRVPVPRARDEVRRLTEAFNQMTEDLVASEEKLRQTERVAAWREIARRIAHEIKNPLSPIQMSIETLKKVWERRHPEFEAIFQESTATILEEVQRMKRIVTEFSDFARMPAPRPHPTELVELVTQVTNLAKETAPPGTEVEVIGRAPETARVDPDQIRQAVLNLVKNALEALASKPPKDGETRQLEVRVEPDGASATGPDGPGAAGASERVRIVVTDNGPGMSPETKQRLFTPYFTTKSQGTGLGLAMVQRIVGEHEGTIRVDSEVGMGTRFVVRLPRAGPSAAPEAPG